VVLEGAVSIAVGALALVWPLIPRQLVWLIALWGVLTGILEILAAVRIPRGRAGYWLLATGGVSSLFLALLILALPHGDRALVVRLLGAYALVFGVVFALAAIGLRRAVATL
jgi:uncharacterized membrane protein HdeD (DUF308 family)